MIIKKYGGFKKYFTLIYWKIQLASLISGRPPLNIIETFDFEISDEEYKKCVSNEEN